MLIPISPLLIEFSISAHFEMRQKNSPKITIEGKFFCLKKGWNSINKGGIGINIYFIYFFRFFFEKFDFIIALAQEYKFFLKVPLGLRLWILCTLDS